jgi:ribonucleoside-diphosphate reductase alpha chain
VLTQKSDLDATTYTFTLEDGREVSFLGSETVEYDGESHNVANLYDALKEGIYGQM